MPEPTAREIEGFPLVDAAAFVRFPDEHVGHTRRTGGDGVTSPVWQYCTACGVGVATQATRVPPVGVYYQCPRCKTTLPAEGAPHSCLPAADAPAEQQASGAGFAQFLEGLRGAAAAGQPFHVRCAIDLECSHPRELYAAVREILVKLAAEIARQGGL